MYIYNAAHGNAYIQMDNDDNDDDDDGNIIGTANVVYFFHLYIFSSLYFFHPYIFFIFIFFSSLYFFHPKKDTAKKKGHRKN